MSAFRCEWFSLFLLPCTGHTHNNHFFDVVIIVVVVVVWGGGICVTTRAVMTCVRMRKGCYHVVGGGSLCVICHPSIDS